MRNILVTGGLGYIGSHTVVALQAQGFYVLIVDDLSNAKLETLDQIEKITSVRPSFQKIDLKDFDSLKIYFKNHKIDGIIHFAAYKAVGESVNQPLMYYRNNIVGLLNILECMKMFNVNNIIFSSSCTVYGQADTMPIHENTPLKKTESPYGSTKRMGEEIIEDFAKATSINAVLLRYFNPVGAHESGLIGEAPNGIPNNLVPYVTQTAMGIREELGVFGNDYNTKDGTAIRDYIDVNDLADAHVKAMDRILNKKNTQPVEYFNLGSGTGSTVLEVIHAFEKANGIKIKYSFKPRRAGDIEKAYADYSKATQLLGWKPLTSLETSMRTAWKFQQNSASK